MCARVLLLLLVLLSGSRFEAIVGWLLLDGVGAYDGVVMWRLSVSRLRCEYGNRNSRAHLGIHSAKTSRSFVGTLKLAPQHTDKIASSLQVGAAILIKLKDYLISI